MADVQIDDHGRPVPPLLADEVTTLTGFLGYQRATLAWECCGLTDEQLRVSLPPTAMTLGGMLKHLALVEDYWFTETIASEPSPPPWAEVDWTAGPDWDWHSAAGDSGADLRALWMDRVERSRAIVAEQLDSD